jgi:predicted RNA-binding protein with PIN domain
MSYIIDGHNLIPKISGMSLDQLDDETHLIQLLMRFCQKERARVIVFFDRAAPGQQRRSTHGAVSVVFVSNQFTADDAIHAYLVAHRREARNFIVVSSDHQVQRDARNLHARILPAEKFADQITSSMVPTQKIGGEAEPGLLSPEEVAEWEILFTHYNK